MSKNEPGLGRRMLRRIAARARRVLAAGRERIHPSGSVARYRGYDVRINDWPNFRVLARDIFARRVYDFESRREEPVILDCGANIGMATLYFKRRYPGARVTCFEPDPAVFPVLAENVARNTLNGVDLVQAALAREAGKVGFYSDGKYGSCLARLAGAVPPRGWTFSEVPTVTLRQYLDGEVDFVKMNIEGAEYEVLADSADRLRRIREMVIEYHHLPGLPRTLHNLLALLNSRGFEYLINDLDGTTNSGVEPPFRLLPESRYFLLVYARRVD